MKLISFSSESTCVQFSLRQFTFFRDALFELSLMEIGEREFWSVMHLSREQANQLKVKISGLIDLNKSNESLCTQFSHKEIIALRGLMLEVVSYVYFPRFTQFSKTSLEDIEQIVSFLAFDVIPRMEEGKITHMKGEKHAAVCQEIELRNIRKKVDFDFDQVRHECHLRIENKLWHLHLSGMNSKKTFCKVRSSVSDIRKSEEKTFQEQFVSLSNMAAIVSHLEFFTEFNGKSNDSEIDDRIFCISIPNKERKNLFEIRFLPLKDEDYWMRNNIDIEFHLNQLECDSEEAGLKLVGKIKKKEVLQFTSSIRDFLVTLCK